MLCRVVVFKDVDIASCNAIRDTSDAVYGTYLKTVEMTSRFDVLLTVHLSIFILVINPLDAQNVCFTVSLFHASTCFEHRHTYQRLYNTILTS